MFTRTRMEGRELFLLRNTIRGKSITKSMGETKGEVSVLATENSKASYRGKFTFRELSWARASHV